MLGEKDCYCCPPGGRDTTTQQRRDWMIKILLCPVRLGESAAAKHRQGFDTMQEPVVHFRAGVVELADESEGENNATPPM